MPTSDASTTPVAPRIEARRADRVLDGVGVAVDAGRDLPRDPRTQLGQLGAKLIELRFPVDRAPRRCQRRGMVSESVGLTSHKSSCNCTGCGMLRAGVCINCAEKTAALILESGPGEIAVEPCVGARRSRHVGRGRTQCA
jgi:hypothetical protein